MQRKTGILYLVCVKYPSLLLLFMFFSVAARSQTSAGTEFWFGIMKGPSSTAEYHIVINAEQNVSGTLDVPGLGLSQSFNIPAGSSHTIIYNYNDNLEVNSYQIPENKAIHIVTDNPVTVNVIHTASMVTDGTLVLPVTAIGSDYMITSYEQLPGFHTEFLIVATSNNTLVEIIPSVMTGYVNNPAGVPFTVSLDAGECYLVVGGGIGDLTGTTVKVIDSAVCKPIAVFEGNECTFIPVNDPACNLLYEQSIPIPLWGKKFITMPFKTRGFYVLRILAAENNTNIYIDNGPAQMLNAGQFIEQMFPDISVSINSDKPVKVVQYSVGSTVDNVIDGDPSSMYISPLEQMSRKIITGGINSIYVPNTYINILTKSVYINDIYIDGVPVPISDFTPVPQNSAYSYAQLSVSPAAHIITSQHGSFRADLYGYGIQDCYAMNGGGNFYKGPMVIYQGDTIPAIDFTDIVGCKDTVIYFLPLDTLYTQVRWSVNNGPYIYQDSILITTYNDSLNIVSFMCEYIGNTCLTGNTVAHAFQFSANKPMMIEIVPDTILCNTNQYSIMLDSLPGTITWDNGSHNTSRIITEPGNYSFTIKEGQCYTTDSFRVEFINLVFDLPDTSLCPPVPITLLSPVQADHYIWSTFENTSAIQVDLSGVYSLTVEKNGCMYSDSLTVSPPEPVELYLPTDTFLCQGDTIVLSGPEGYSAYEWNTGDTTYFIVTGTGGTYWLSVKACQIVSTDTIYITQIDNIALEPPNIFTPNNDGINDEWFVLSTASEILTGYRLSIFNRWGILVWESTDSSEKWDGMILNQPATAGTYYYILEIASPCIPQETRRGFITLTR